MAKNEFKKIVFKNGLRLVLVKRQSLAASVLILVQAGSEYETKKINGLSHFLEHMMFKGTKNRPQLGQIAEELAGLGAQSNAFTSQEYTGYWAKAESHKLPQILDIVSDLYLNPIFNPAEIEKERGVVIEEINMYEDMPMRRVPDLFNKLLYGDQPAGWRVDGEKNVIKKMKREDFLAYRDIYYAPQRTIVVVAGNFDEKRTIAQVRGHFGELAKKKNIGKSKTKEHQLKPQILTGFKKSDQSHLVLGVRTFNVFDKKRQMLQVLSAVLGGGMSSRLFKKIREDLGAAYYVSSSSDLSLDHGYLAVSAGVDHQKTEIVIKAVLEEFRRLRDIPVPEKELQRVKDYLVGSVILNLETSDELAGFYGEQEIIKGEMYPPSRLIEKLRSVTAAEVQAVARDIFKNEKLNLAVIGPYKKSDALKKILKI